jgi:hypothetical protein
MSSRVPEPEIPRQVATENDKRAGNGVVSSGAPCRWACEGGERGGLRGFDVVLACRKANGYRPWGWEESS